MGTQGPGRKRIPNRDKQAAEDDALSQIAREAEARLAAKRAARAEAREIRMKELERQQKELFHSTKKYYGLDNKWGHIEQWMEDSERYSRLSRKHASISDDEERMSVGSRGSYRVEERTDREFVDKGSRTASTLSAATLASLGGASSRRGSCDTSFSVETEASIREMKDSLAEAEEKYRRAMVSNAQLHNDKTTLMFQVENLREELSDMEELLWEARRRWEDSSKELERERQTHSVLKVQFKEMEDSLRRTNELLKEVSDLRLKSSSYRQEVSDLQEALQWKEKQVTALERHREISDIVRIERDGLRSEVVRLRDSLKNHGVAVSPDSTPNGDAERAEDDSACCLAEDSPPSGRESTLGKASERQPAEGSKTPQNDPRDIKRTLSAISVNDQTRPSRERWNPPKKYPARNRQPRNKRGEKDPTKKPPTRVDGSEANKKQPGKDRSGDPSQISDKVFKDKTTPDSNSDSVGVMEMDNLRKMGESTSKILPVRKVLAEKVFRSKLVPPRPSKEIILDNRAVVLGLSAAGKLNSLSEETINQDVSLVLENEASSSETDFEQKGMCTLNLGSQSQDEDRNQEGEVPGFSGEAGAGTSESKGETQGTEEGSGERNRTKLETKVYATSSPETLGRPETFQDQSTGESLRRAAQIQKACPEHQKRTSAFVPEDMWTFLETTVQDLLQGLEDKPGFVVEMSRIFSEILICLHQWISDLENTLRNRSGNESCLNDGGGHESTWPVMGTRLSTKMWLNLTSLTKETAEGSGCVEGHLARHSASPRVSCSSDRMEDWSGSSNRVCSTFHHHAATRERGGTRSKQTDLQINAASGATPAESSFNLTSSPSRNTSVDFVFVDSYFDDPRKNSTGSRSDLSLGKRSDNQTHLQVSAGDSKELSGNRSMSAHSNVGQSSKVRRFMEVTAEEIRALAVPELALLGLQEGQRLDGSSVGSVEAVSVGDMDSCEEADEEEEEGQEPPSQQQKLAMMEAEVQSVPALGNAEPETDHEGPSLDNRKNDNTDCKIS
ncbi:leucine-rich repeat flightless-interacting protein 1 isoform X3 [Girardinichthys multiradiatus]|uniref:leucine-rich repeat flightless-interacting protein 1 isoform X3 n=1 Tax=Girardinichthys multiradiatus TaxID=208333 RepID=UPI001FAD8BE2|nr:leucine-rich repeat flightless-interacting protein 1 isoform X3 [Girardinichthys multiradiatus]